MVADDPQHGFRIVGIAGEGAALGGHFGRGGVADAGHDRRQRAAIGAARGGIIGEARRHQQAADIGVAEAERAVVVGQLGDFARGELRHQHRDFQHHGPQPHGVLIGRDVEDLRGRIAELQQVQRGQIAGRVVEEHIFRTRIGGADFAARRAGVPVVDGGVELQAGIGGGPGGVADLVPQLGGAQGLGDRAVGAARQFPVPVLLDRAEKTVGDADGIVGVLAGDGEIGFRIPVRVVFGDVEIAETLPGVLQDALDEAVRAAGAAGELDLALQDRVLLRVEAIVVLAFAIHGGLEHGLHVLAQDLRARDQRRDLFFFADLPVDEGFDIGMVGVHHHHLGGAARGAARLDRAGGAVADLQEGHQAGGLAAARKTLVLAAQRGEIGAGAGAVLEQARLAHPQVHDAAFIDQVVADGLDEAGVGLRMLVGGIRRRSARRSGNRHNNGPGRGHRRHRPSAGRC